LTPLKKLLSMEDILQAKKEENNSFLVQWNLKNNERNHLYGNWHPINTRTNLTLSTSPGKKISISRSVVQLDHYS